MICAIPGMSVLAIETLCYVRGECAHDSKRLLEKLISGPKGRSQQLLGGWKEIRWIGCSLPNGREILKSREWQRSWRLGNTFLPSWHGLRHKSCRHPSPLSTSHNTTNKRVNQRKKNIYFLYQPHSIDIMKMKMKMKKERGTSSGKRKSSIFGRRKKEKKERKLTKKSF